MNTINANQNIKRALIINFNGIGNGLVVLPLLKCIEESNNSFLYYHSYNLILDNKKLIKKVSIKNLLGLIPTKWRRFREKDWDDIYRFIKKNKINLIINLRNEGPKYDVEYFKFKNKFIKKIKFWNLDFRYIYLRKKYRLLSQDLLSMLNEHGVKTNNYRSRFLEKYYRNKKQNKKDKNNIMIGFFTGASQEIKKYSVKQWVNLAKLILKKFNCNIEIYGGTKSREYAMAKKIAEKIGNKKCIMVNRKNFNQLIKSFCALDLLVSNDTFAVHLATSLGIPVIGLYFATDPHIWGSDSKLFIPLRSQTGAKCKFQKKSAGNCLNYYGGCKKTMCKDIAPEQILKAINKFKITKKYAKSTS